MLVDKIIDTPLLKEMKVSRESANVAFVKFTEHAKFYDTHVFCFYEGEDGKYYNQRIKNILNDNIISIIVGNKEETLKLWRKIKSQKSYNEVKKMFFVDMDMDAEPTDKDDDLYVTPCYSVENLYANKYCFANIIESEFSINKGEIDYDKSLQLFDNLFEKFCNEMIEFNALVYLRNKKGFENQKALISSIKTHNLVNVEIDKITKSDRYSAQISDLMDKLGVNEEDVSEAIDVIRTRGDFGNTFRGKNQIDFLVDLLKILKTANTNSEFFSEKRHRVTINLTKNRLSEMSQYAVTPNDLINFISTHRVVCSI